MKWSESVADERNEGPVKKRSMLLVTVPTDLDESSVGCRDA